VGLGTLDGPKRRAAAGTRGTDPVVAPRTIRASTTGTLGRTAGAGTPLTWSAGRGPLTLGRAAGSAPSTLCGTTGAGAGTLPLGGAAGTTVALARTTGAGPLDGTAGLSWSTAGGAVSLRGAGRPAGSLAGAATAGAISLRGAAGARGPATGGA
jgi:hypothetical protein